MNLRPACSVADPERMKERRKREMKEEESRGEINHSWAWWHTLVILALMKQRQEGNYEFKVKLVHISSSRTAE